MKRRYLIVLGLYSITHFISAVVINSKCFANQYVRFILRTLLGYSIFASGLHYFSKLKRK